MNRVASINGYSPLISSTLAIFRSVTRWSASGPRMRGVRNTMTSELTSLSTLFLNSRAEYAVVGPGRAAALRLALSLKGKGSLDDVLAVAQVAAANVSVEPLEMPVFDASSLTRLSRRASTILRNAFVGSRSLERRLNVGAAANANASHTFNLASAVIEGFWLLISIIGLVRALM